MSDNAAFAQAAARIATLEQDLAQAHHQLDQANTSLRTAQAAAAQAQPLRDELGRTKARVAELEQLLADPAPSSGVEVVKYFGADGTTLIKSRYRAADGSKFKLLPEALHQQAKVGLMSDLGITDAQAEAIVSRRAKVREHLAAMPD